MDSDDIPTEQGLHDLLEAYREGIDPLTPVIAGLTDKAEKAHRRDEAEADNLRETAAEVRELADSLRQIVRAEHAAQQVSYDEDDENIRQAVELSASPLHTVPGRSDKCQVFGYVAVTDPLPVGGPEAGDGPVHLGDGSTIHGLNPGHTVQPGVYAAITSVTDGYMPNIFTDVLTSDPSGALRTARVSVSGESFPLTYVPGIPALGGRLFLCAGMEIIYVSRVTERGVPHLMHALGYRQD